MRILPALATAVSVVVVAGAGGPGFVTPALAQAAALTQAQSAALAAYDNALRDFKSILAERRAQIDAKQALPNLPGQAVYLARLKVMSTYKDLTDALPSRIGRPNKFGVPPAYFDADIEPLIEEYAALFASCRRRRQTRRPPRRRSRTSPISAGQSRAPRASMPRPPMRRAASASAFSSPRPTATRTSATRAPTPTRAACRRASRKIARGAGRGRRSSPRIAALDPAVAARDDKETARVGNGDQRFNHWTAVRNGLMNAHADLFRADPGDHEDAARRDRSDEAVPAHPDHPYADARRARVGQLRGLSHLRPEDHGIPAQQHHLHLRQGGPGAEPPRPFARSSMRCGCSTTSSSARGPSSRRSRPRSGDGPDDPASPAQESALSACCCIRWLEARNLPLMAGQSGTGYVRHQFSHRSPGHRRRLYQGDAPCFQLGWPSKNWTRAQVAGRTP